MGLRAEPGCVVSNAFRVGVHKTAFAQQCAKLGRMECKCLKDGKSWNVFYCLGMKICHSFDDNCAFVEADL